MFLSILSVLFVGVLAPTNIVASVLNRNTEPNMRLGRVYGGVQAEPNQFPHHVGILINGHYTCGGSIIASNAILTAAHCISGRENLPTEIIAGTTDHTEPKIKREVSQKIRHENYTTKYIVYEKMKFLVDTENDIALLILDEPLEFNEIVKKIELEAEDLELGSEVIIIGWGHSNESPEDLSQHLKFNENFKVTNKENCSLIPSLIPATDDRLCLTRAKGNGACDVSSSGDQFL